MRKITSLDETEIGKTVFFKSVDEYERGKVKSIDHERGHAFVVYDGGNYGKVDNYMNYTAARTAFCDLYVH